MLFCFCKVQLTLLEFHLSAAFVGCIFLGSWGLGSGKSVIPGVTVLTVARILWSGPSYFLRGEGSVP